MAGEIKLTLNDFKAVLGKVNDGNVKVNGEGQLQKVNFGGKFTRMFRANVETSAAENSAMRKAFMSAILDSREGKTLQADKIREIKTRLGIATEEGGEDQVEVLSGKLERRTIAEIMLDVTGGKIGNGRYEKIADDDGELLVSRGACSQDEVNAAKAYVMNEPRFSDNESLVKFAKDELPSKLFGFSKSEIVKFVGNNAALIKETVFVRACYMMRNVRAQGADPFHRPGAPTPRALFFAGIRDLMRAYAEHREVKLNFRGLVPTPPGIDMNAAEPPAANPQLAGFQTQLDGFDGFIDALFVKKQPQGDRPLGVADMRSTRANVFVKHELRQTILNALAVCQNNSAQALEQADLKPLKGLLSLNADMLANLSEKAQNALREKFFTAVADASYAGGENELKEIMKGLADVLKPLADATDTEAHLRAAFAKTGIDQSKFATLKAELMVNGRLDDPCQASCNVIAEAEIATFGERLEHPGTNPAPRSEVQEALNSLAEAFRAADARLAEGAEARKELIEKFCHNTDRNNFPAIVNDDAHKVFRSKVHLMSMVITRAQCDAAGIRTNRGTLLEIKYDSLGECELKEATEEKLKADGKLDAFKEEVARIEKKIDSLLMHVSAQEIKAQKQYSSSNAGMFEQYHGGTRTLILDAMRDRLLPEGLTEENAKHFSAMLYSTLANADENRPTFMRSDILTPHALKVEWEIRLAEAKLDPKNKTLDAVKGQLEADLAEIENEVFTEVDGKANALVACYRKAIDKLPVGVIHYTGFGSLDIVETLKLLNRCGISVGKIDPSLSTRGEDGKIAPPDFDRAIALMQIIQLKGGSSKGIVEWFERVSGKPISELSREAVIELRRNGINDPLDAVKENTPAGKAVRFLKGEYSVAQAGFGKAERIRLTQALGTLARRLSGDFSAGNSQQVTIGGVAVTFSVDAESRQLIGTVNVGGRNLPIAYPMDIGDLNSQLQNDIVSNLDSYLASDGDKQILLGIIPDEAAAANNISRARELCTRVIAKITGKSTVDFAAMTMNELRDTAKGLINGTVAKETVNPGLSQSYNSREAIELGTAMQADRATMDKISWSVAADPLPPPEEREGRAPTAETIRDFAADLVMNKNTWVFDVESGEAAGTRLLKLLKGYAPEVRYLIANPGALDALTGTVKDAVEGIVTEVAQLTPNINTAGVLENLEMTNEEVAAKMKALDGKVKTMMSSAIDTLQEKITNLFIGQHGVATDLWKRTSADINGTGGLDVTTPQGKFIKDVLDKYFKGSSEIDRRAMLSAFIRNAAPGDSDGKLAGELIKGAGPLLQKMLQGLPVETFPPETQAALQDTRSNLAPIPREVVNARLANMITSSNGFITGIEVKKSLGAASVGQAFLCRIYTKNHPCTGEEVVIKILRPNVETAARREYALISEIAREQNNGMDVAFADRYAGILKEFDFTIESGNIDRGAVYEHARIGDEATVDIHAMGRYGQVLPTTGALVLQKAEGIPVSNYTRDARRRFNAILDPIRTKVAVERGGEAHDAFTVTDDILNARMKRLELKILHNEIIEKRKHLGNLVQAWFQQAFEGGFVHGDMHSGNVMTDETGMKIIDFGNCTFLSESERNAVLVGLAACVFGEAVSSDDPSIYLLKCLKTLSTKDDKAKMDAALKDKALQLELKVALTRGTKLDVVTRMLSSLTLIQNHGYPLPESITVFTQSLSRLQAAISDADTLLGEIEEAADEICVTEELKDKYRRTDDPLTKAEGGFQIFRDLDRIILDATGGNGIPSKVNKVLRDKMYPKRGEANFGQKLLATLKTENLELVERNAGLDFIDLVLAKYGEFKVGATSSSMGVYSAYSASKLPEHLRMDIERHRTLVAGGGDPTAIATSRDAVLAKLMKYVAEYATEYTTESDHITDHNRMVPTFEECGFNAMETVLKMKLKGKEGPEGLKAATAIFTGSIDATSGTNFATKIGANANGFFAQVSSESRRVNKINEHCSNAEDPVNYVSRRNRRMLQGLARDFLIPPLGMTDENIEEVIEANLAQIRKALGRDAMTLAEMRYFVRLVEQQNWKPEFGIFKTKYNSPFHNLGDQPGDIAFLCAMHRHQNDYLRNHGLEDQELEEINVESETALRDAAPEYQPEPVEEDDDE